MPAEKFRAYFIQDYIFVRALVSMVPLGIAKAPGRLNGFLMRILDRPLRHRGHLPGLGHPAPSAG